MAELITGLLMFSYLAFGSKELRLTQERGMYRPTDTVVRKAWDISGPMALQNLLMRGGYIAATVIVAPLGTVAIAASFSRLSLLRVCMV